MNKKTLLMTLFQVFTCCSKEKKTVSQSKNFIQQEQGQEQKQIDQLKQEIELLLEETCKEEKDIKNAMIIHDQKQTKSSNAEKLMDLEKLRNMKRRFHRRTNSIADDFQNLGLSKEAILKIFEEIRIKFDQEYDYDMDFLD